MHPAGKSGEDLAARYLAAHGYRLRERNYRCPAGEIDIIAESGGVLCFIEVKQRSGLSYGFPAEAVTRAKQRHIVRTAQHYLQSHPGLAKRPCRFDVIALSPQTAPQLIPDAFQADRER